MNYRTILRSATIMVAASMMVSALAQAETTNGLKSKLAAKSAGIRDLQGDMVVTPASRSDAREINKGIIQFLDYGFRQAKVSYKRPDKFRAEGTAKGVSVSYVMNGNRKQFLAPALMLKKTDDVGREREKKQTTLDLGFASDALWRDNNVRVLSTDSKGIAKVQLVPIGTRDKRKTLMWIDTKSLKVLKTERYGGRGNFKARYIYSKHRIMAGLPVATVLDAYSADGGHAGSTSYKTINVNKGISDSLFRIR